MFTRPGNSPRKLGHSGWFPMTFMMFFLSRHFCIFFTWKYHMNPTSQWEDSWSVTKHGWKIPGTKFTFVLPWTIKPHIYCHLQNDNIWSTDIEIASCFVAEDRLQIFNPCGTSPLGRVYLGSSIGSFKIPYVIIISLVWGSYCLNKSKC